MKAVSTLRSTPLACARSRGWGAWLLAATWPHQVPARVSSAVRFKYLPYIFKANISIFLPNLNHFFPR